ncbi:pathogenesis-related protein 1-like [Neltuma alba]|uniref:pathogenesis-related protein 1-like n=1 Tax=Neltuma alba TaxID=207710 RepID=UPI0010A34703|nr:pathogenesis-related protein 1-like [Prosopis alba]
MELLSKLPFSLFFFLFAITAYAQNSPQDYVEAHNAARSQVGVPNIRWDNTVAAFAQNYAKELKGDCQVIHSGSQMYGENIAWSSGDMSDTDAVKLWVAEKANYDSGSGSCVGGNCRHYTQVVWKDSTRLGCAKVRCYNGGTFISCNYYPPGNIVGQKPY